MVNRLMQVKNIFKQIGGTPGPRIYECAHNIVLQERGTCWFNSNINILFLTHPISTMLVKRMNDILKRTNLTPTIKKTLTVLEDSTPATSILIYKMLYAILFANTRETLDPRWISEIAGKIKGEQMSEIAGKKNYYCELKEKYGLECALEFSNGGCSFHSLLILLNSILIQGEDFNIIDFSTDLGRFFQSGEYYKPVEFHIKTKPKSKCTDFQCKKIKGERGSNQGIFLDSTQRTIWSSNIFKNEFNRNHKTLQQIPKIIIVFLHVNLEETTLPTHFTVDGTIYVLEAASLVYEAKIGQGHVIVRPMNSDTLFFLNIH